MMLKILIFAALLSVASSCIIDADCPENSFCFVGDCIKNQTVGGSCKYGMQCVNKDAFCIDGLCSCLAIARFDGHACVISNNYLIFPVALAATAGLLFFVLGVAVILVMKRRRAQKAARAVQAPPLPVKYDVPMHKY